MATSDRLRLLLRDKYGLVHVPNRHKLSQWVALTKNGMGEGLSDETAGLAAARELFPYELKEHAIYASTPAARLLELAEEL